MIRVTIKTRLGISLAITLLVIVGLGIFLLQVQDRLNDSIKNLEMQSATIQLLSDLQLAVQESLMPANDYIITANPRYAREFGELDVKIEELFSRLAGKERLSAPHAEKIRIAHNLYGEVKQVAAEIFNRSAKDFDQSSRMEKMDYDFGAPMISRVAQVKQELELSFSHARKESARLREMSHWVSSVALGAVVLLLLFVGLVQVRTISRSLEEVVRMLEQVAEGSGDLTQRLEITRSDELGRMAELFNRFIDHVHGAIREVVSVTAQLTSSARCMQSASHELHASAAKQLLATEQTSSALNGLEQSVADIAQDAGELSGLATNAASASLELSSSFDEVVRLTERLDLVSDTTLTTVDTINDSSAKVAANVAELLDRAQRVVEAVSNVQGMAGEIVESAREQRRIANGVQDDATRLGIIAITDTTGRMERLRESVSEAAEIMDSLGRMSGEIGRIVSIINEVTGKTNLLALNASIIAAQAGEHGKSFAVVADEVKALAQRTANSTKEIELMIEQIREKTVSATTAVHQSATEAEAGVIQAREVATTFTTILEKMTAAQTGAENVASSAERQSEGVEAAMVQIEEMRVMVDQINQAAEEQSRCAEAIVQATLGMREFTREVRDNVGAQSDENLRITRISQHVFTRVQVVAEVTLQQKTASGTIAEGQREVLAAAIESQAQARAVEETAASLDRQAAVLKNKVGSFKV